MDLSDLQTLPAPKNLQILQELYSTVVSMAVISSMGKCASFTWVAYDWITNLDDEVEYFWEKPTTVTFIYFLIRYYNMVVLGITTLLPLIVKSSQNLCVGMMKLQIAAGVVVFVSVELLLTMRLFALYGGSKRLLGVLLLGLLGSIAYTIYVISRYFKDTIIFTRLVPFIDYDTCLATQNTSYWTLWIAPLAFQTVSFVLAAFKAFQALKLNVAGQPPIGKRLVNVLMRDSMIYFISVAVVECTVLLTWRFGSPNSMQATASLVLATLTIVSCRLLINLRAAARGYYTKRASVWSTPTGGSLFSTNIGGVDTTITERFGGQSIELEQWRYDHL